MIRAFADESTNGDWVVEVDGRRVARFPVIRYGRDAVYYAARAANELRREVARARA